MQESGFVLSDRSSYGGLMRLPAWLLLDENRQVVASVRACSAEEARRVFVKGGLSGVWLRRADP